MRKISSLTTFLLLTGLTVNAQNPLACFPIRENVNDYSGNNYQTTLVNTAFSRDRFGTEKGAALFDGTGGVQLSVDPFKLNEFTYSAWCKLSSLPSNGGFYCLMSVGGDKADHSIMVGNYSPLGYIGFGFGSITTSLTLNNCYSGELPVADQWYHLVVNRTNTELKLFVDGELVCSKTYSSQPAGYIASNGKVPKVWMATRNELNYQSFHGALDEIKIFDQVLTPEQVNSTCFAEVGITESIRSDYKVYFQSVPQVIQLPHATSSFELIDMNGKVIVSGIQQSEIEVKGIPKGVYVVIGSVGSDRYSSKVIIY